MIKIIITTFFTLSISLVNAQEIALTFDDAPTPDVGLYTGNERTERILKHLSSTKIQAAFFVITANINAESQRRISRYTASGHLIANHTHSHQWIHNLGTKHYIADLKKADSILRTLPGFVNWFRYPFLDEGKSTVIRDSIRNALSELNLTNGYITVDNYDWYINSQFVKAVKAGKIIDYNALRELYLDHVWTSIQFYDNIARNVLGRSPKHVLLLHENDLTALYLTDLIDLLQKKGWKIIPPKEAYNDPIAITIPDVLFNGQGRIGAIAKEKGIASKDLVQQSEDEEYLNSLMNERKVFK